MERRWGSCLQPSARFAVSRTVETSRAGAAAPPVGLGKRHAATNWGPSADGDDTSAKSDTSEEKVKPAKLRKHRKSTHAIRKEEKEHLTKEMEVLTAQLTALKQKIMASMGDDQVLIESVRAGRVLRDGVQSNQLKFGEIASIMSEYSLCNAQAGSPLHDQIKLTSDQESRKQTLRGLKADKLQKAQHFLQLRRPNTNPRKTSAEGRRFEMDNGDYFSERFMITQFKDAKSARQIYELLLFYFCNIEISISEKIGHITVREDGDNGGKNISQNRLVSTTNQGTKMESNTITFSEFYEHKSNSGEDYGLVVMDYVDKDARYPYQPDRRVRKDVIAVMEVREKHDPVSGKTVVLTRWVQNRLHQPEFPLSFQEWHNLREHMDLWGQTMQHTMMEGLHADALGLTTWS